jgi:hypothetical protein
MISQQPRGCTRTVKRKSALPELSADNSNHVRSFGQSVKCSKEHAEMAEHTECTDGDITTESLRVVLMGREDSQSSEPTVDHIQLLSLRTRVTIENLDTNRQGTFSAAR